jgi:antitoxin ParD1/3/4
LTPELERLVNEKVESGLYKTASEVVREALRL